MTSIEVTQDTGLARLIWEVFVNHRKDEMSAVSVVDLASSFRNNGTEPDEQRSSYRARRTVRHMVAAQEAVWVKDPQGHNTHYRMLTVKERLDAQGLKIKAAKRAPSEENFK